MSRVGKNPIQLVQGVTATLADGVMTVKGKLGELSCPISDKVEVTIADNKIVVKPRSLSKENRTIWGTTRANINNMVKGVSEGFVRKMELIGVGYKAQVAGKGLKLSLGFSHEINYEAPAGIKFACPDQTQIEISGIDKRLVGAVAAQLRAYRAPEPYKGKGVKYAEETILRKEGKKK